MNRLGTFGNLGNDQCARYSVRQHNFGEDDVAALFPRGIPHDAADGLDDIDLGIARGEEEHGIERGDIDALGKAADVAEDAAGVRLRLGFEPIEFFLFLSGVHGAIDVIGLADEVVVVVFLLLVGIDDFLEHPGDLLGGDFVGFAFPALSLDDLAEGDGAAHGCLIAGEVLGDALLGKGFPAADDAGGVIDFEGVVLVLEQALDAGADVGAVDGEHEDFVIGEEF